MADRNDTPFLQLDLPLAPREKWKPVPGYEGFYEVSNRGQMRSLDRMEKYENKFRLRKGIPLNPSNFNGYKRICLSANGERHKFMVHVIVLSAFVGPRPEGYDVNHIDGNKANNAVHNLEWVTRSENLIHAFVTGLKGVEGDHPRAKLTAQQILEIRALEAQGAKRRDLALLFGVKYITIYDIVKRRHWRYIP